jgi:hypothetical protein
MGLMLGGVGDDDGDAEGAGPVEVAVAVVVLDNHDLSALGQEPFDDPDPHGTQSDHHHVARHPRHPTAAQGLLDPAAHEEVGEEGEAGRDQGHPTVMRTMAKTWSQALWAAKE